jgi:hypothetical protein
MDTHQGERLHNLHQGERGCCWSSAQNQHPHEAEVCQTRNISPWITPAAAGKVVIMSHEGDVQSDVSEEQATTNNNFSPRLYNLF